MSTPAVLLIRTLPHQQNRSMDRYADELGDALRQRDDLSFRETTLQPAGWARSGFARAMDRRIARFVRYRRHVGRQRADIYHLMDHTQADLIGALPAERTVVTCHDLMLLRAEHEAFGFRGSRAAVRLFRWRVGHLRQVAHVACISEQTRQDLIELVGVDPERTSVIPNGVDPRFLPFAADRRAALRSAVASPGATILLHVSTGDAYKNVEGTLRTLAALRADGRAVRLLRAGRPLTPAQAMLAGELGVIGAISDLGRVPDERLVELYNLADVLLFPSHYEGFGWPPLEAMA
ncbi:MAG: glycosyltransferase, partial [Chloroflexi bacterium]|nr:glycosyltransferase [Chloroflexota bacterium]